MPTTAVNAAHAPFPLDAHLPFMLVVFVVAVLDECTSAVSIDVEESLYRSAVEKGTTCITVSQRLSLLELNEATCHWPVGDPSSPDFFFCGGKALSGLPYCAQHSRVAYQPAADRRRAPAKPNPR